MRVLDRLVNLRALEDGVIYPVIKASLHWELIKTELGSISEIREDWCAVDLGFSEFGTFWIDMSELFQYFEYVTVCQYREKWKEIRIRRNVVANTKNTE